MSEEAKKSRNPRAPVLNVHHLARSYKESEGDFYKVLSWLCGHYNYNFKPQQVKNAFSRLNKELSANGYEELKFAPAKKDAQYLQSFMSEWEGKGLLKKQKEQMTIPAVAPAKKPSVAKK